MLPVASAFVHLDAPSGARLEVATDSAHGEWETACDAPCDAWLSTDLAYRVTGSVRRSPTFELAAADGGRETIRVRGGSKGLYVLGWIGIGLGGGATAAGVGLVVGGALLSHVSVDGEAHATSGEDKTLVPGLVLIAAGLPVLVAGLLLRSANHATDVDQQVPPARDAWLRTPTWQRVEAAPRAIGATLVEWRF